LEVLRADFVRTARAKGVTELWVVAKHTLRNAALPILTITGLQFGTLLGGAVVTETVFAWPGIGRLAIQSIYNRDYPVVQSTVFIGAVVFSAIARVLDIVSGLLDPWAGGCAPRGLPRSPWRCRRRTRPAGSRCRGRSMLPGCLSGSSW